MNKQTITTTLTPDYTKDSLFDGLGMVRLRESYMLNSEASPQDRYIYIAKCFGSNEAHSQRLYRYISNHWLSLSTPILSYGKAKHGLPISCYLPYLSDTSEGLIDTLAEVNQLSMLGGGVGIGVGIRSADNKSTGVMAHLNTYDACCLAYKQDGVRRGSYAAYLDVDHPDILPFLEMRKPTGDHNIRCMNIHHGINLSDAFMRKVEQCMVDPKADSTWDLIDPHSKLVKATISVTELWQRIIETRMRTGEPYLCFIDTCNKAMQPFQKALGLKIRQSNLCSEIILPTDHTRTAVCCLSSFNLTRYDEWKDEELFVRDSMEMLDNALTLFIKKAPRSIHRAVHSASKERSIGLGVLGFHDYLQQKLIPFESEEARLTNLNIFKHLNKAIAKANLELGTERGSPDDCLGTGRRFANTMAIAPTATSSIIMGNTSPSIEPYRANAYRQDTMSGTYLNKNKNLNRIIQNKLKVMGQYSEDNMVQIWSNILSNNGSIQHLDMFSKLEKAVFKTAMEIDQQWIITHASDRQPYIDQAQSVNLFMVPTVHVRDLHMVHFNAWKKGLKTLYYCRSAKLAKADKISSDNLTEDLNGKFAKNVVEYGVCRREEGCMVCE